MSGHVKHFYDGSSATRTMIVLHGESITDQASPRTPTQRTFQPQTMIVYLCLSNCRACRLNYHDEDLVLGLTCR